MKIRLPQWVTRFLFVFSLCLACLLYGVAAGVYQMFPYPQLRDSIAAGTVLLDVATREDAEPVVEPGETLIKRNLPGGDSDALILVNGGPGDMPELNPDGGCIAWLMDREGTVRHYWKYDPDLWETLENTSTVPGYHIHPVCVHMLADGGLIVSFQGIDTWPFGIGMARLDRDSRVLWAKECHAHHWFDVADDGKIVTPTLKVRDSAVRIGETSAFLRGPEGKILEDMVAVLSPEGDVLHEFSLLESFHRSGLIGLYQGAFEQTTSVESMDPLHLNYVQIVDETVAAEHDWLAAGDLMVSCRSVNAVLILDAVTHDVKWRTVGSTLRQHGPIFRDPQSILVFDNFGGNGWQGGTRIAQIDLIKDTTQTVYPRREDTEARVSSPSAGHLNLSRSGTTVLMAVSGQGRVLEVELESGQTLWEYDHPGNVYTAKYCYDVQFDMNGN